MNKLQKLLFKEYKKNGYLDFWTNKKFQDVFDIGELGFLTTEVSEAIEAIFKKDFCSLSEELADIFIRLSNFATRKGIDLKKMVLIKNKKNLKRGLFHGKKV